MLAAMISEEWISGPVMDKAGELTSQTRPGFWGCTEKGKTWCRGRMDFIFIDPDEKWVYDGTRSFSKQRRATKSVSWNGVNGRDRYLSGKNMETKDPVSDAGYGRYIVWGMIMRVDWIKNHQGIWETDNNSEVDFTVESGKDIWINRENKAGKTTLMRVLYGMYEPDGGEILIDGNGSMVLKAPKMPLMGIGMVHQHFALVPTLTVTQGMILGALYRKRTGFWTWSIQNRWFWISVNSISWRSRPKRWLRIYISQPAAACGTWKALYLGADLLIMDEPTAVLSPRRL